MMMNKKKKWHLYGTNNLVAQIFKDKINDGELQLYSSSDINLQKIDNWIDSLVFEKNKKHIILYTWGVLRPKKFVNQTLSEINEGLIFNTIIPIKIIEKINNLNCEFRLLYISSESAKKGSYDGAYFIGKASVEAYIKELRLSNSKSSINALAPSMISDAGMTIRRKDKHNVKKAAESHPKQRLLMSDEVAATSYWILNDASDYITNTVIYMNGGKFTRMI